MFVPGGDSETMTDDRKVSVACMVVGDGDDSSTGGMNRSAVIRRHIDACVECTLTAEWIQALAEAIGNVPHDRPDRRGVRGVGKTHGGKQMEPAAGDGDHRGIALQESVLLDAQDAFDRSIEQYTFLKRNAAVIAISRSGLHLLSPISFANSSLSPSIWPVMGHITDSFGERLDPFSGEGAFHTGVDVASDYGAPVHATADGIITIAENHAGYGRLVVIDHGFGITTWYAHLSAFSAVSGARLKRGEVVVDTGISGRSTGPPLHY